MRVDIELKDEEICSSLINLINGGCFEIFIRDEARNMKSRDLITKNARRSDYASASSLYIE